MRVLTVGVLCVQALVSVPFPVAAQPRAPLTGANAACVGGPVLAGGLPDTLDPDEALPDDSGFVRIFNGKNLKGWWEGCGSTHSNNDKTYGGVWLVDSAAGLLFANQPSGTGAGSVLMTNKSYGNYELVFDLWPSFGNDAGVFNRVTPSGNCYQTGIDYIANSSVGGVYFEGGYAGTSRNYDPYVFGANKAAINFSSANTNANNRLDSLTRRFANPADFGCPASGCGIANWTAIWDTGGWNQMRVQFFGTGASASNKVHNHAWIRKLGSPHWIPTVRDSVQYPTSPNPIGLQIHGGTSSWGNANGNWYRNIKVRPLTDHGVPVLPALSVRRMGVVSRPGALRLASGVLSGTADHPYEITVRDAAGHLLQRISGPPGVFQHRLDPVPPGILMIRVKTDQRSEFLRIARVFGN